ncbi:MAG: hypothetical protein AAB433_03070 [Nitrospirota bacterium]|jgi:hypothetical protein
MRPHSYQPGQYVIWIAKRRKNGEAYFEVPAHVVKVTPKRIAIQILKRDATLTIRYVAVESLQPGPPLTPT